MKAFQPEKEIKVVRGLGRGGSSVPTNVSVFVQKVKEALVQQITALLS